MFNLGGGNDSVYCFIDDDYSAVMTKVVSAGIDPVELIPDEARRLAGVLVTLAGRRLARVFFNATNK